MTYSYQFSNPDETFMRRTGGPDEDLLIPCVETNRYYRQFLESGAEVEPYVAPPEPEPLTTEEKVNRLLSDYGLTRDEMRTALEVKASPKKPR